jgi:hypothetical protein
VRKNKKKTRRMHDTLFTNLSLVVSHIPDCEDATASPAGDVPYPAGDVAFPSRNAVISHYRCILTLGDAHPPHELRHI